MRKIALLSLLCSAMALAAMSPVVLAQQRNGAQTAPHEIEGVLGGTLTFVELPFTEPFTFPWNVATIGVASGHVMGLGNSVVTTFHHPGPGPTPTDPSVVLDGRFIILAADGDKIQGTYTGTTAGAPPVLRGSAVWVITGGTGRFKNVKAGDTIDATAYVTFMGFDVFEWPVTWVLEGTINY